MLANRITQIRWKIKNRSDTRALPGTAEMSIEWLYTVAVVKYRRRCCKQAKKKEELGDFLVFNVIRAPHPPPSHININNIGGGRPRDLLYYYYHYYYV